MGTVFLLGAFEESNPIAWVNIRPGDAVVHKVWHLLYWRKAEALRQELPDVRDGPRWLHYRQALRQFWMRVAAGSLDYFRKKNIWAHERDLGFSALGLTTSCWRTSERILRGLWALHASIRRFTMFHQVLVKLLALSNFRHALASTLSLGSARFTARFWPLYCHFVMFYCTVNGSPVRPSWCTKRQVYNQWRLSDSVCHFSSFLSCAPSLTELRKGFLVSDRLDCGGILN